MEIIKNIVNNQDITEAVDRGVTVYWKSTSYEVIKDRLGEYLIRCCLGGDVIGLTNKSGTKFNGEQGDFFTICLFENYHLLPETVQNIVHSFNENEDAYSECQRLESELGPHGYVFDFGLDGVPYDLREVK